MLFQQPQGRRPERILLAIDTTPETSVVEVGGRSKVFLRNLRYSGANGHTLRHFRCANCGWSDRYIDLNLRSSVTSVCPGCKAKPSTTECSMWHTYGHCSECTDGAIERIPFPDKKDPAVVDTMAHVG